MKIPLWETHWFQLTGYSLIELKDNLLMDFIKEGIYKSGNLNRLSKELGFSGPTFYNLVNNGTHRMVSVAKLKKILCYLDIDFSYVNDKIQRTKKGKVVSIENPKFPIKLNNKDGAYLLGLIVSDGCIYLDKTENKFRTKYAAGEIESEENFRTVIKRLYGEVHIQREYLRNCAILKIGSSIIGNSLLKVGAISGQKASVDGHVPWIIRNGSKEMKQNYLKAAFDDESSVYKDKKRNCGFIILSRYRHVKNLTKKQEIELGRLDKHMSIRKFPTGHIGGSMSLKKAVKGIQNVNLVKKVNNVPKLLQDESNILNELGIDNRLFSRCLTKTHLGRYSVCFDLFINKKDILKKFYKEVGYSLERKQTKLAMIVGMNEITTIQHSIKEEGTLQTNLST